MKIFFKKTRFVLEVCALPCYNEYTGEKGGKNPPFFRIIDGKWEVLKSKYGLFRVVFRLFLFRFVHIMPLFCQKRQKAEYRPSGILPDLLRLGRSHANPAPGGHDADLLSRRARDRFL